MIQIYKADNTLYDKNGDMSLTPSSASVHVILNGSWEANIEHPVDEDGRWRYIVEGAVVKMPSFNGEQLFRVKKKEKSDSGVTATMEPIFYDAKDDCWLTDIRPTEKDGQQALDIITAPNKKYTGRSNITVISTAYYEYMNLMEAINGNNDNSFINRWGGEILFDNFTVIINEQIGGDYGVDLRYGKNLPVDGLTDEVDIRDVVTRIYPKAYNGCTMSDDGYVDSPLIDRYPTVKCATMIFEDVKMRADAQDGDEENGVVVCDTQEELDAALTEKCQEQYEAGVDKPKVTISADMVLLKDTEQYAEYQALEDVSLGDTVHCHNQHLDITTDARVVELEYNSILKRVDSVVLGDFQYNFFNDVSSMINRVESAIRPDGSVIGAQVQGIINGVRAQLKAQSSIAQKQKIRATIFEDLDPESPTYGAMCLGTMGFEIASKRTADGRDWDWRTFGTGAGFFADFIVAGTMLADRIKGGTLELGGKDNGDGIARVLDGKGNEIVRLDNEGVYASGKYVCNSDEYGRSVEISEGEYKIISRSGKTVAKIFAVSDDIVRIEAGNNGDTFIRLMGNSKSIYIDAETFGVNGFPGKTGRVEFSDGTYLTLNGGVITGRKRARGCVLMAWTISNNYLTESQMQGNALEVYNFFSARGWTLNAISGMLGNMERESNINPGLWQSLDYGNYSGGYGLVQWTPATNYTDWGVC